MKSSNTRLRRTLELSFGIFRPDIFYLEKLEKLWCIALFAKSAVAIEGRRERGGQAPEESVGGATRIGSVAQ